MPAPTPLGHGQRVGFFQSNFYNGESVSLLVPGPPTAPSGGDRLFLWVDYHTWISLDTYVNLSIPGWTYVHRGVGPASAGGASMSYSQQGFLYTKLYDGSSTATITATVSGAGTEEEGQWNWLGIGAHIFGYGGVTLDFIAEGKIPQGGVYTHNETVTTSTTAVPPGQYLILTEASNDLSASQFWSAPSLDGPRYGFSVDDSFRNPPGTGGASSPALPLLPRAAFLAQRCTLDSSDRPLGMSYYNDGQYPQVGDRIIVEDYTWPTVKWYLFGIYEWNGAGVPMTRTSDANTTQKLQRAYLDYNLSTFFSQPGRLHQGHWVGPIDGPPGQSSFEGRSVIPSNSIASAAITKTTIGTIQLPVWTVYQGGNATDHYWWAGWSVWGLVSRTSGWRVGSIAGSP